MLPAYVFATSFLKPGNDDMDMLALEIRENSVGCGHVASMFHCQGKVH